MLADPEEIREAEEEGVTLHSSRGPRRCIIEADRLNGLETVACLSVFDEQGRFHPRYDDDDLTVHGADLVVEAIGQSAHLDFLTEAITERLTWERGRLQVDADGHTSEPWLWAAGDVVEGPDVVHAIAGGHRVAASIHQYLTETVIAARAEA
jgi:glutamate synthase (NADPH/NADH) small chain